MKIGLFGGPGNIVVPAPGTNLVISLVITLGASPCLQVYKSSSPRPEVRAEGQEVFMEQEPRIKAKVLHVATEMAPLSKIGGLGDVVGALPKALRKLGVDARVLIPAYPKVFRQIEALGLNLTRVRHKICVALRWRVFTSKLWKTEVEGVPTYLLDNPVLFESPEVYPDVLTPDTALPMAFLSYAALELPYALNWKPQIFHCHDWPTALMPVALRWHKHYRSFQERYDTVLTIHNLAHQGILSPSVMDEWALDRKAFNIEGLEFFGQANLLKGAIITADMVTTVSPRYSWEIQTSDGGMGLDGILSRNRHKLLGVVNGLDEDTWNPGRDPLLPAPFSLENLDGKRESRNSLLSHCKWEEDNSPILAFVGRLVEQKGVEILLPVIEELLTRGCRLVVVGSGFPVYERKLEDLAHRFPDRLSVTIGFNENLAHLVYAGSDIFLMPSLFEPCGLSQLIALRYGTIPVARAVGGLADTVIDVEGSEDGYGFLFTDYNSQELLGAVDRALAHYANPKQWRKIQYSGMVRDFSWEKSASIYREIYFKLLGFDEEV